MKVLYFEGAGMEGTQYNDVENCRIRTAFTNDRGKKIYLELGCGHSHKKKNPEYHWLWCDFCHYITGDSEDCNINRLDCERNQTGKEMEWTKANILKFVNENCDCSFDKVVILPFLSGYRVYSGNYKNPYNMMEDFHYDEDFTKRCEIKRAELQKHFCRVFNQQYDNTSYWVENGEFIVRINASEEKRISAGYPERQFVVEV